MDNIDIAAVGTVAAEARHKYVHLTKKGIASCP